MRKIVAFDNVSADGYFSAPDGSLQWVVQDDGVYRSSTENGPRIGAILFGRRTYEQFERFWPHALDDSKTAPDPHIPGRRSETVRDMAVFINEAPKIVFSRTRKDVAWKNSRLVRELDPREIVALKEQPGQDMIIFGSGSVVSQLTRHGLIDEYHFAVSPLILGDGRSLVREVSTATNLTLQEAKPFPSGVVLLRYARAS